MLAFDGAYQLELTAGAVKVVTVAVGFEVNVPFQIVGQEAGADFQSDACTGKGQVFQFAIVQNSASFGAVAPEPSRWVCP